MGNSIKGYLATVPNSFIEEADWVVGYRTPRRDPFMRELNGWGWSALVTILFGLQLWAERVR